MYTYNMQSYFEIQKNGVSPFQNFMCYLGGSAIQTAGDNPVTAYRQLVQQYAKSSTGETISPQAAVKEARSVFWRSPFTASMSGLYPRMAGVLLKRIPKFGFLLGYTTVTGDTGEPGYAAATAASILSAPFINPVRMIEKQQRVDLKTTGKEKPVLDILREAKEKKYKPLFRGTVPLMGHSFTSAMLGLVGQPQLQRYIQTQIGSHSQFGQSTSNLIASAIVSPIYVVATNPLSRLEVIMQTNSIKGKRIGALEACGELTRDMTKFGMKGMFRGQGIGMAKAIVSLTLFHEGRLFLTNRMKIHNGTLKQ
jgi:hypothetical protein